MAGAADLDVAYVARLARINLSEEEANAFQKQLGDVLNYVEKLRQTDVTGVEAAAHALPVFNVFREDAPRDWFTAEQALSNAPRKANGLFIVPKDVDSRRRICRRLASLICNHCCVAGKFPRGKLSVLCENALKLSMEKLALICRWTLMLRLKKRTRRMSIFHWAASRLQLKTSSMSWVSLARAPQRSCAVIEPSTTPLPFKDCALRAQSHLEKPTWTSLPWVRPPKILRRS